MRLKQLCLAGFKSFVDPTVLSFPSNRVAVVGPNGCGKSNVIDSIRWVMGESSAKTLRGSAMTDVIFNGSSSRNPADSAEVELVFDQVNLPQYPDAEEISLKRRLTRDGQSHYFINSIRCRRKDITDILLGTGLGPRSYSIIEQGMISRFIEAKPDELRNYIEEAAGISRYKERRRETELRMEHTRENMARLDDVRQEVDKNIDRLKRQVRAAEKFRQLKEAEHLLKAQLLAMRWRTYQEEVEKQQEILDAQQPDQERAQTRLLELDSLREQQREAQDQARARFEAAQGAYYSQQAEVEKLAQSIEHSKEKHEQLQWDLEECERNLEDARHTLETDGEQAVQLRMEIESAEEDAGQAQMETESLEESVQHGETALQEAQTEWDEFNQQWMALSQQTEIERQKIKNLEQTLGRNRERLARLEAEKEELDLTGLEASLSELDVQVLENEARLEQLQQSQAEYQEQIQQLRDSNKETGERLHSVGLGLQQAKGRLASLDALQEAALGKQHGDVLEWLRARGFPDHLPRLAQVIKVEPGWERAVETVLGAYLESICLEDLAHLTDKLDSLPQGKLSAVDRLVNLPGVGDLTDFAPRLSDKVRGDWPVAGLLAGVYVADSFAEAYRLRAQLGPHESVITAQGLWLGPNWLSITEEMDNRAGVFAREQDILRLRADIEQAEAEVLALGERLEQGRAALHQAEDARDQCSAQINAAQQRLAELKAQHGGQQARLEQMSARARRLLGEYGELAEHLQRDEAEFERAQASLAEAESRSADLAGKRDPLSRAKDQAREWLEQHRRQWQQAKDRQHQVMARLHAMRADVARLQQGIARLEAGIEQLSERRFDLQSALDAQQSVDDWQNQYLVQQARQQELQAALEQSREALQQADSQLRALEEEKRRLERHQETQRALLEETRLALQANLVRRQSVEEQLAHAPWPVDKLLEELPPEASETAWVEGIQEVESRLQKLGSINMAALEEYEDQDKRKKYLDEQFGDLDSAMNLLQKAIDEIDTETRNRFLQTLNKVDEGFRTLFPHIFGGGEAYLKLTSEDVLTAGVMVMARPPGKRNSTIHLLSGGEKALTAVSLVFAIFELNPAPFCMLDEVDAPLDDTNVGRFCNLVKKMSEQVQFIFITHNKITMEMADQLVGVTMQEPGVSRPVSVDIDLAVEMVGV